MKESAINERLEATTPSETHSALIRAPFALHLPDVMRSGAVFSSPHSGRAYFREFLARSRLALEALRASEDAYVDALFAESAMRCGAPLIAAMAPRAYVDLNRDPADLDPQLVNGVQSLATSARVAAGLGVAPRVVAEGVQIYNGKLTRAEVERRIARWHAPYHERLAELLAAAQRGFGRALLIDCHSMPSEIRASSRRIRDGADVILGDRFGFSADQSLVDAIEDSFERNGFRVARNAPFAGGHITERYGRPASNVSAVQIELDRGLYLDQASITPATGFKPLIRRLEPVIADICALIAEADGRPALAAE